jgi:hypothetical protein
MGGRGGTWGPGVGGSREVKQEGQNEYCVPLHRVLLLLLRHETHKEKIKQIDSICIMKEVN